ncbi:hypothetical protein FO519_002512 [Halicephalobus sp. NKZ332]|nr:hypothetical protein FO519_002512 [Halicephalobus sp. NKZ332]
MSPTTSISTVNLSIAETSSISIGGTVAERIAKNPHTSNQDQFREYRDLCEVRLRRLERYKKAKSFCSLDSDDVLHYSTVSQEEKSSHSSSASTCSTSSDGTVSPRPSSNCHTVFESQVELLKRKMISMMETDVELLQKLVTLGETIQELKTPQSAPPKTSYRPRGLNRTNSETSLSSSFGEEEDDWRPLDCGGESFSHSMSAITRLYVEDEEEDEPRPNVQYFSRKNSVLRIPIPPRSSNRILSNRKIQIRPSQLRKAPPRLLSSEDSGNSSSSDTTSPQQHSPVSDSSISSSASGNLSCGLYGIQEASTKASRRSNSSVDSGIVGSETFHPSFVTTVKTEG